jgi:hypothetical protein
MPLLAADYSRAGVVQVDNMVAKMESNLVYVRSSWMNGECSYGL